MTEKALSSVLITAALLSACGDWREDRLLSAEFVYRVGRDPKLTRSAASRSYFERHRGDLTSRRATSWWRSYAASSSVPGRVAAAYALGEARRPQAAALLRPLLLDPDGDVRRAAAEAWGKLEPRAPVEPLLGSSRDPDGWVRLAACESLGWLGDPKGVAALRERLADPNGLVRAAAAAALAKLQPEGVEVDLAPLLDDPNGAVRLAAAQALQRLRGHNTDSSP